MPNLLLDPFRYVGRDSSVGIATGSGLDGPGIEYRWGTRFSAPVQTGLGAHTAACTMGTRSFPGVKSGRGVTLTPHPLLVPWSRKSRAIPLLLLWAVRPVQSLSARTGVHFTFYLYHLDMVSYYHLKEMRDTSEGLCQNIPGLNHLYIRSRLCIGYVTV